MKADSIPLSGEISEETFSCGAEAVKNHHEIRWLIMLAMSQQTFFTGLAKRDGCVKFRWVFASVHFGSLTGWLNKPSIIGGKVTRYGNILLLALTK